jgi:hypothetical protein
MLRAASDTCKFRNACADGPRPGRIFVAVGRADGGDVGCTHEIPVRLVLAMRAAKLSGAWLGDPTPADHARGWGASLVDELHLDAGHLRLVAQGLHQVSAAPLAKSQVLHPADVLAGDTPEITNNEDAHSPLDSRCDHFPGRLVVRLANSPTVAGLESSLLEPVAAPAARATLPWLGCAPAHRNLASLPVVQVHWIGDGSSQSDPEFRMSLGHWRAHPLSIELEDSVVEAHRNQGAFAPREPGGRLWCCRCRLVSMSHAQTSPPERNSP